MRFGRVAIVFSSGCFKLADVLFLAEDAEPSLRLGGLGYADSDMGPERIAMLGQRKMMRAKMNLFVIESTDVYLQ